MHESGERLDGRIVEVGCKLFQSPVAIAVEQVKDMVEDQFPLEFAKGDPPFILNSFLQRVPIDAELPRQGRKACAGMLRENGPNTVENAS